MSKKILTVDDEPHIRKMVSSRLNANGFNVIMAVNGREAIEKAEQEEPDLILMDVMMPEMDGIEVLVKLKANEKTKAIPVIMLTAKGQVEDVEKACHEGAEDYLVKPFNPVILISKINKVLEG